MGQFTFSGGGGGGGGAVSSVFTRTGAVVAQNGDYTAGQVTNVAAGNLSAVTVQAAINELDTEKAGLDLLNVFLQPQTITVTVSGGTLNLNADGVPGAFTLSRYQASTPGANFVSRKARGSLAVPSAVLLNDGLSLINFQGYGGTDFVAGGRIECIVIEPTPSMTAMGTSIRISPTQLGTITPVETLRVEVDTGLSMYGTNVVIDNNRIFRPRSYTVGTLPSVTATGIIHCSDLGGGGGLLSSDGTGWVREDNSGTITIATDAGHTFTWDRLADAPVTRGNATLTATRTATLSATGARNGDRAQFVRLGGGAFNWDIVGGTTFSLTGADQYCVFEYDGAAWNLIAAGRNSVAAPGISGIRVEDEGSTIVATSIALNFAGAGVTVTDAGGGEALVTIPGGGGGSGVDVEDEGVAILTPATTLNFIGAGVTVTNGGGGQADITIPGGGGGSGLTIGQYIGLRNSTYF